MLRMLRKPLFAFPFGCLVAIATHFARFGDEHAFGGDANDLLVAGATGGSIVVALLVLHAFLTAGTTTPTGTLAAARAARLVPSSAAIFTSAAAIYYGIESLEGNGIEFGLPTVLLALSATIVAFALRSSAASLARFVADIVRDFLEFLARRERGARHLRAAHQPIRSQTAHAAPRIGRAPPNGR